MEELKELKCIYDGRKSFYKKAYYTKNIVKADNFVSYEIYKLYSYNTLVCEIVYVIDGRNNKKRCYYKLNKYSFYSNTTARHVKEFIKQYLYYNDVKRLLIAGNYSKNIVQKYNKVEEIDKQRNVLIYAI